MKNSSPELLNFSPAVAETYKQYSDGQFVDNHSAKL